MRVSMKLRMNSGISPHNLLNRLNQQNKGSPVRNSCGSIVKRPNDANFAYGTTIRAPVDFRERWGNGWSHKLRAVFHPPG
ncbi:hypothetical protein JI735_20480 [Paenibacillus sonchi]|uniref:Uncharacterized protein n=1 Tax=Paenibacillus sonchi TaxID=373687 RepID=A0A974SAS0_9BACL|nr:hypothetical protein JI735_20480 [Paenibacillus sonchi]